jgi:hypothetical protein
MRRPVALLPCLLAFGLGCGNVSGPPEGLSHSLATNTCGPADGPATAIYLAPEPIQAVSPSYPYVRIAIWQDVTQLAGETFRLDGAASALYTPGAGTFEVASGGSVTIKRVGPQTLVEGVVDLQFSFRRVLGTFSAAWVQLELLCG